jgi:vitamin B12 transporter
MKPTAVFSISMVFATLDAAAAELRGRVLDPQNAAVAGAEVRVSNPDQSYARTTRTGETGEYRLTPLPAGTFVVEGSKDGFRRRVDVVTVAREPITLDLRLEIGGVDENVVVTATGLAQVTSETSKALTLVDGDEIRARNETALFEIIRFVPGVQIRSNGGPGQATQMRVRGLRPDANAVLIDGLRFRDASTAQGDAASFFSNLNFIAADRVEVLRGSGSSLYGTNAVGGVVNLVSRTGGGPFRAEGQAEAGSLGWRRARGTVSGGALADRLTFTAGALQYNLLDGLDGNDGARSTGGQASLRYALTPKASLSLRFLGSDDDVRLNTSPTTSGVPAANIPPTAIVDAVPAPPDATYIPGRDDPDYRRDSTFYSAAAVFRHRATETLSWQASAQRVHTNRVFRNGPQGVGFQPAAESYSRYAGDVDTLDARAFLAPHPALQLTAGYELEREGYFDRQDNNLPDARRVATESRITQNAHAGFGALQLSLLERRLQIAVSGRGQWFHLSRPRLATTGAPNVYEQVPLDSPPAAFTADVSAAYLIAGSSTKLRAHVGNAYRAPGLYERFGGGFANDPVSGRLGFTPYGDPRLEPDRYRSLDAGFDQSLLGSRVLIAATAFHTRVTSITAFDSSGGVKPDTDPYGRTMGYVNGSGGFSRGLELGLEARPVASLRLAGSYTYTDAQTDRDITVPGFVRVLGLSRHVATFVATFRRSRLDTTLDVAHNSEIFGSLFAAGRARAYRYPAFTKAALVAGYRLSRNEARPIRAYFKVDNLLDQTYYELGWRALGRTVVAGLSAGF